MFSADAPPRNCSSSLTESVCPVGRIRSIREVYDWEQKQSQALLIDVNHSTLVSLTPPGPPAALLRPRRHRSHAQPPSPAARARRRQRHRVRLAARGSGPLTRLGAREFIGMLADVGTWESWDLPATDAGASTDYADTLRETVPGVTSDEIQHATATNLVIDIDCTALQAN
jgi:hypothetical protein